MRLAVFTGQYFWFDGRRYSTDEAFVRFVTSFYPYFEKIIFCDAVKVERKTEVYVLDPRMTEVCPLPDFNVYSFWKNLLFSFPEIYRRIRTNIRHWDMVWLPGPHPVSLLFASVCRKHRTPFFQIIRSNLIEQVRHSNRGLRRLCATAVVATLQHVSQRLARRNLTFAVGREMYDIYRSKGGVVCETKISLVSEKDINETLRTKAFGLHKPVRLLSVGRLDPEKGLYYLIQAAARLIQEKGLDIILQVIGKGYKGEEERRLRREVEKRELAGRIVFGGYVSFGPKLLKLYRESDIFILPSLTGEGVPQTIFEAMACGTPIIATRVAGIPQVIRDEKDGLLVAPASSIEIASAVERLVADDELRKLLARNGIATARHHTIEIETKRIWDGIQGFLRQDGFGENSVLL